jgi:hypothetical protein
MKEFTERMKKNLDESKSVPKDEFKEDLKNVLKTVIKIWKKSGAV